MSTVEEITAAIEHLSADDVARIQAWLAEYTERLWDAQIAHMRGTLLISSRAP